MSSEIITILAVGMAMFGTHITTFIYLAQRIDKTNGRISTVELAAPNLRADMAKMDANLTRRMSALELETKDGMTNMRAEMSKRISSLELNSSEGMAKLQVEMSALRGDMPDRMTDMEIDLNRRVSDLDMSLTNRVARLEGVVPGA